MSETPRAQPSEAELHAAHRILAPGDDDNVTLGEIRADLAAATPPVEEAPRLKDAAEKLGAIYADAVELDRLCEVMHDAYEAAAADEGWQTQSASRKPWVDVPEANKRTMRIAVRALLAAARPVSGDTEGLADRLLDAFSDADVGCGPWCNEKRGVCQAIRQAAADVAAAVVQPLLDQAAEDRAATWQEGYDAGYLMARMWGHVDRWEDEPTNPYLASTTERSEKGQDDD